MVEFEEVDLLVGVGVDDVTVEAFTPVDRFGVVGSDLSLLRLLAVVDWVRYILLRL